MLAVNYTELRGNMKECMDKVSDEMCIRDSLKYRFY